MQILRNKCPAASVLLGVTLMALALRLMGINWGLPMRLDIHPDELDYVMKHAAVITWSHLDPGFLNYPGFLMYLIAFGAGVLRWAGILSEPWQAFIMARILVATIGALTIPLVYRLALELGSRRLGAMLAALWVCLLPLHNWECHTATTDVLMTFWIIATLLGAVLIYKNPSRKHLLITGVSLGFAVGSKYTAALVLVAPVLALLFCRLDWPRKLGGLVVVGLVSLIACFAVTPCSFLRFGDTLAAMAYEHKHTTGMHYGFSLPAPGIQYHRYLYQLLAAWPFSFGLVLYLCAVAGTIWAAFKQGRRGWIVLGFMGCFFGILGHWTFTPLRYYLPLVVLGAMFAGIWLGAWLEDPFPWRRRVAALATLLALLYTGIFTWQTNWRYCHETRIEAARWVQAHYPRGTTIALTGWHRYLALPDEHDFHLVRVPECRANKPGLPSSHDLLELSSMNYDRAYRHHHGLTSVYNQVRHSAKEFHLIKKFESHFINKPFYCALDPMYEGYFVSPTIEFYSPGARQEKAEIRGNTLAQP